MNAALPRFLKSAYRKEPLPSFLITIGVVDAVIGGLDDRWSLFTFGLGSVGVAIALRWWLVQQHRPIVQKQVPQRYLPPSSSHSPLPPLATSTKKNSQK
ncbi:MAG: hypothetical protein KME05_11780 [Gloeocapsa sp. UFS-A4-WI-NPMV-4B04]|jgi:hypothetical protein|nr:hypothetical protein [Gloeocapsa sp. UFS-A4-WI-NPMV-4B04]